MTPERKRMAVNDRKIDLSKTLPRHRSGGVCRHRRSCRKGKRYWATHLQNSRNELRCRARRGRAAAECGVGATVAMRNCSLALERIRPSGHPALPDIAIVSSDAIIALRYQGLLPHAGQKGAAGAQMERPQTNDTLAIYSDHAKTIYLVEGWSGRTPADLSVLVHEMVHHFQNVLGLKHDCPQEREKLAYRAQDRWLGLFGHSLETDFELDGFSLLGKTGCFYRLPSPPHNPCAWFAERLLHIAGPRVCQGTSL